MILLEDLGCFDPAWKGWRIQDGQLISSEGWAVSPGNVLEIPLMRAQIASYQRDQRIAKAELDALEEQPEPGAGLKLFTDRALRSKKYCRLRATALTGAQFGPACEVRRTL
jgi:hypothetical protein